MRRMAAVVALTRITMTAAVKEEAVAAVAGAGCCCWRWRWRSGLATSSRAVDVHDETVVGLHFLQQDKYEMKR